MKHHFTRLLVGLGIVLVSVGMVGTEFVRAAEESTEARFVRSLARNGYYELARYQVGKLKNQSGFRENIPLLKAFIDEQQADKKVKYSAKVQHLENAEKRLKRALDSTTKQEQRIEIQVELARILRKQSDVLAEAYQQNKTEQALAHDAENKLEEAADQYTSLLEQFGEQEHPKKKEVRFQQVLVNYQKIQVLRMQGKGESAVEQSNDLLEQIKEYQWNYAGRLKTLKLVLRKSLIHLKMAWYYEEQEESGQIEEQREKANYAFDSLTAYLDKLDQFRKPIQKALIRLGLETYYRWGKLHNEHGDAQKTLEIINQGMARKSLRDRSHFQMWNGMMLERAKALRALGRRKKAMKALRSITSRSGRFGQEARSLKSSWEKLKGGKLQPKDWLELSKKASSKEDYHRTLFLARRGLSALDGNRKRMEREPKLLQQIASAYSQLGRWYESAMVYRSIHDAYENIEGDVSEDRRRELQELAAKANFLTAKSFARVKSKTGNSEDKKAFTRELEHLKEAHPDSKYRGRVQLMLADAAREAEKYPEAVKNYQGILEEEEGNEPARVKLGLTYYLWGKKLDEKGQTSKAKETLSTAAKQLEDYFNFIKQHESAPAVSRDYYRYFAASIYARVLLHSTQEQFRKANRFLKELLLKRGQFEDDQYAELVNYRFQALVKSGDVEGGREMVEELSSRLSDSSYLKNMYLQLARIYDPTVDSDEQGEVDDREQAARYYARWVKRVFQREELSSQDTIIGVLNKIFTFGQELKSTEITDRFVQLVNNVKKRYKGTLSEEIKLELEEKLAKGHYLLNNYEKALEKYEYLLEKYPNNGFYLLGKARCLQKLAHREKRKGDQKSMRSYYEQSYEILTDDIFPAVRSDQQLYWQVLYQLMVINIETGANKRAESWIELIEQNFGKRIEKLKELQKDWDSTENWWKKFRCLQKKVQRMNLGGGDQNFKVECGSEHQK